MKHLKLFISHCWYSLICLYFFIVSSRPIKFSAVLQQAFCQDHDSEFKLSASFLIFKGGSGFRCHPPHPPQSLGFGDCKHLQIFECLCRQWLALWTLTGENCLHLLFSIVPYSLSSVCLILQCTPVNIDCLNTTDHNVGKWCFGLLGTVKRSVLIARFLSTVMPTSHCTQL